MNKNELLKFCRFYHGENSSPHKDEEKSLLWDYERVWIDYTLKKDTDKLGSMLDDYSRAGLSQFRGEDDTPATLKALLFNRFCKWRSGSMLDNIEPFKKWYQATYR